MYKVVIGLEVHVEVLTKSKNFSFAKNEYSLDPNIYVDTVDIGLPGILPVVNEEAVRQSIKAALALNCQVPNELVFDRKNYYYPDLPKGYQITQMEKPIGTNGYVTIRLNGEDKKIYIHDIHLEEDTASLDHYSNYSLINYNRAGVPLLETVTEPCMNSIEEAITFLESLRSIFLYCGISDVRSDLGQIRCDVNVSLMEPDAKELGTKVEMKNINSFNNVKLAIECEIERQTELLDKGEKIIQETRRFDDENMCTHSMRAKVDAIDYKYYAEPNIPPIELNDNLINEIKSTIPTLQYERINNYINNYNLSEYDATILVKEKETSDFFEETIKLGTNPKTAANWLTGAVLGYLNKNELKISDIYLTPNSLYEIINMIDTGKISTKQSKEVLLHVLEDKMEPTLVVEKLGIKQIGDEDTLREMIVKIIEEHLELIEEYRKGRNVFDFFVGQVMKQTRGQANPSLTAKIIKEEIDKR